MSKGFISWRDLLFIAVGAIIATIGNNWEYFIFDPKFSISDLFIAVLGGFLGLYIGSKLNAEQSSERIEKDLIISEISPLKLQLTKLYSLIENDQLQLNEAVQIFRSCSQVLVSVQAMAKMCKNYKDVETLTAHLLKKVRQMNGAITGYPVDPTSSLILIPTTEVINNLTQTKEINEKITELIIKINRG